MRGGTGGGLSCRQLLVSKDVRVQTGRLINMEDGAEERDAASVPDCTIALKNTSASHLKPDTLLLTYFYCNFFPFVVRNSEHFHI